MKLKTHMHKTTISWTQPNKSENIAKKKKTKKQKTDAEPKLTDNP